MFYSAPRYRCVKLFKNYQNYSSDYFVGMLILITHDYIATITLHPMKLKTIDITCYKYPKNSKYSHSITSLDGSEKLLASAT